LSDDPTADDAIREHLRHSAELKLQTADACAADIRRAADLIAGAFKAGGKLLICGNGGGAAEAQHMAAELVSRLTIDFERPGLPAIALTTDTSILTAYANDFDFDGVFARQVQALGRSDDVLLCISTSGSSRNVVQAAAAGAERRHESDLAHWPSGRSLRRRRCIRPHPIDHHRTCPGVSSGR
jgi:D-sedoheptulose 7-phosphate isomerase